jgi:TPP-dependent pyruvate/acetoin dehydrogenase alpha subunit
MENNMPGDTDFSASTMLAIYRKAALIRRNDERVIKEMMSGKLQTPYYSSRGQEIIPAALSLHLNDGDTLCTIYRGTHDMLAKGFPLKPLWAELAGRVTGSCKGKGGTMHLTHPEEWLHGYNGDRRFVDASGNRTWLGRKA